MTDKEALIFVTDLLNKPCTKQNSQKWHPWTAFSTETRVKFSMIYKRKFKKWWPNNTNIKLRLEWIDVIRIS